MEQFVERYERPRLPVVVTGLCDRWPAAQRWSVPGLLERFAHHKFKARRCRELAILALLGLCCSNRMSSLTICPGTGCEGFNRAA